MMLRRRAVLAALAALAWVAAPQAGRAAEDTVLKWGDNLAPSLDPHALSDVPSAFSRLNMYDSLLRVVGNPPDIVHVVPEMKLSASYRPLVGPLKAEGIPKPSRNAWYLDPDENRYKRLTVAVRTEIAGAQQ